MRQLRRGVERGPLASCPCEPSSACHPSLISATPPTSLAMAEDTPRSKPLPPPPDLPFPSAEALAAALSGPEPRSDLALDARSLEHLADLLKQSFAGVKLKEEVWLVSPLLPLEGPGSGKEAVRVTGSSGSGARLVLVWFI